MKFKRLPLYICFVLTLLTAGLSQVAYSDMGTVKHTVLDNTQGQGAILFEAKQLRLDLKELARRIVDLGHQAIQAGDGEMLACARELEAELQSVQHTTSNMEKTLLLALSEDNARLQVHGMRLLDTLEERAHSIEKNKDACRGEPHKIYVEFGVFDPVWRK